MNINALVHTMLAKRAAWWLVDFSDEVIQQTLSDAGIDLPPLPNELHPLLEEVSQVTAYAIAIFLDNGGQLWINEQEFFAPSGTINDGSFTPPEKQMK